MPLPAQRRLSQADINSMKKEELKSALEAMIKDQEQHEAAAGRRTRGADQSQSIEGSKTETLLQSILDEMRRMNAANERRDAEIKALREDHAMMKKVVVQQQRFLEMMDQDRRATNVIVLGVSEEEDLQLGQGEVASTTEEKTRCILEKIGAQDVQVDIVERLGKARRGGDSGTNAQNRPRPIKITLRKANDRQRILTAAKNLERLQQPFSGMKIKKDTHPAIRREFGRLRETENKERAKPENQGKTVIYDYKQRAVLVDGQVVDSFQPLFF